MHLLRIRPATTGDVALIRDLALRIWPETYIPVIGKAQVDYMLELMYSLPSLEKQMKEGTRFLVASEGNEPVGFASFQEMEPGIFKLHKLYVLPSQQGKGTGRKIVDHIISHIRPLGAKSLQLQVNRNNKAKSFYEKLGFGIIKEINLDIGGGFFMDDFIMEKRFLA